jgi:hypothetical protein
MSDDPTASPESAAVVRYLVWCPEDNLDLGTFDTSAEGQHAADSHNQTTGHNAISKASLQPD